jgi:anti-sigma factor RsiW
MNDQWTSRLSEYLDGELTAGERQALEAHLSSCGRCRATLDELRLVVENAAALNDRPPTHDLWPDIARRIGLKTAAASKVVPLRPRRRFSFTMPQLAAAAVLLVFASAGGAWLAMQGEPTAVPDVVTDGGRMTAAPIAVVTWTDSTAAYDQSVAQLQQALAAGRERLDTATVRVLEQNLAIIDRAIAEARAALARDPGSAYLNRHLAQTMRTKLELLRRAQIIAART